MNMLLSSACAVVSLVAAACILYGFRDLDDYFSLRISTSKILRERTIENLTKGYDLRCCAIGNCFVDGSIKDYAGGFPVEFEGGVQIGNIIQIESRFFRVVSTVEITVELSTMGRWAFDRIRRTYLDQTEIVQLAYRCWSKLWYGLLLREISDDVGLETCV